MRRCKDAEAADGDRLEDMGREGENRAVCVRTIQEDNKTSFACFLSLLVELHKQKIDRDGGRWRRGKLKTEKSKCRQGTDAVCQSAVGLVRLHC